MSQDLHNKIRLSPAEGFSILASINIEKGAGYEPGIAISAGALSVNCQMSIVSVSHTCTEDYYIYRAMWLLQKRLCHEIREHMYTVTVGTIYLLWPFPGVRRTKQEMFRLEFRARATVAASHQLSGTGDIGGRGGVGRSSFPLINSLPVAVRVAVCAFTILLSLCDSVCRSAARCRVLCSYGIQRRISVIGSNI